MEAFMENVVGHSYPRMLIDSDSNEDMDDPTITTTVVQSGLKLLAPKNFKWELQNFHVMATDDNLLSSQEYNFDIQGDGDVSKTNWTFFLQRTLPDDIPVEELNEEEIQNFLEIEICYRYRFADGNDNGKWNPVNVLYQMHASIQTENGKCLSATARNGEMGHIVYSSGRWSETIGKDVNSPKITILSFNANQSHLFLINHSLNIHIDLRVYRMTRTVETIASDGDSLSVCRRNAREDFLRLLNSGDDADAVIITKDGDEIRAHQCILKARSTVFNKMFNSNMSESRAGTVEIKDMSSAAVKFMLHFIYTGEILPYAVMRDSQVRDNGVELTGESRGNSSQEEHDDVIFEDVLHMANKYELDDLSKHVDSNLLRLCTAENCKYLFRLCGKYTLKSKELIKNFIKNHPEISDQILDDISMQF